MRGIYSDGSNVRSLPLRLMSPNSQYRVTTLNDDDSLHLETTINPTR